MKRIALFLPIFLFSICLSHAQSFVGLEDGTKIEHENISLKKPMMSKGYLVADDSARYSLDNVRYYQNYDGFYMKRVKKSGRYEFLQREFAGAIDLYGITRSSGGYNHNTHMYTTSSARYHYYRKGENPIKLVTFKNIKLDLSDCDACMQEAKKGKTMSVLSTVALTSGLAIVAGSFISVMDSEPEQGSSMNIPPGIIIGGAVFSSSLLFNGPRRRHYRNAIKIYNERH